MAVFREDLEMRDFFSFQAMQFMAQEETSAFGYEETFKNVIEEGIAAFDEIEIKKCFYHYENKLK